MTVQSLSHVYCDENLLVTDALGSAIFGNSNLNPVDLSDLAEPSRTGTTCTRLFSSELSIFDD
jgi:hypothetical protein